jgi:hypothetical protein
MSVNMIFCPSLTFPTYVFLLYLMNVTTVSVFVRSNAGIVGSNPTQGMAVSVYSVCVVLCVGSGLVTR